MVAVPASALIADFGSVVNAHAFLSKEFARVLRERRAIDEYNLGRRRSNRSDLHFFFLSVIRMP